MKLVRMVEEMGVEGCSPQVNTGRLGLLVSQKKRIKLSTGENLVLRREQRKKATAYLTLVQEKRKIQNGDKYNNPNII